MNNTEHFQHLLPAEHRRGLVVIPVRVLRLSMVSLLLVGLGLGILLGTLPARSSAIQWGGPACILMALLVGAWNQLIERKAMEAAAPKVR